MVNSNIHKQKISLAIVNYKKANEVENLICQFIIPGRREFIGEIIIINNFIGDVPVLDALKKRYDTDTVPIRIVHKSHNTYFVPALNEALRLAVYPYLLFSEPNFTIEKINLEGLIMNLVDNAKYAGVAPRIKDSKGNTVIIGEGIITPWIAILRFMHMNKMLRIGPWKKFFQANRDTQKIEFPSLCNGFILYNVSALREVGGFSRRLLMHYSENDIGRKVGGNGHVFLYDPSNTVIHDFGMASRQKGGNAWVMAMMIKDGFAHMDEGFGVTAAIAAIAVEFATRKWTMLPSIMKQLKAIQGDYRTLQRAGEVD